MIVSLNYVPKDMRVCTFNHRQCFLNTDQGELNIEEGRQETVAGVWIDDIFFVVIKAGPCFLFHCYSTMIPAAAINRNAHYIIGSSPEKLIKKYCSMVGNVYKGGLALHSNSFSALERYGRFGHPRVYNYPNDFEGYEIIRGDRTNMSRSQIVTPIARRSSHDFRMEVD